MKKSILMLGASERHVPFLKKAQKRGLHVICIDKDKNAPGNRYCDVFAPISIRDKKNALWFAEAHGISACIAIPDIGAETGAYINSKLNLKGIKHYTYLNMTDKARSKVCFREAQVDTPADYPDGNFPYIAKPLYSTGSDGIFMIDSKEQLDGKITGLKNRSYLIEEYIEGDMFSADVMVQDGKIIYGLIQDRFLGYEDCFVDSIISSPSNYGNWTDIDTIFPICERALKSLSFTDGPVNLQFIARHGIYYLIEVNPRISGPYGIECHTLATGIDWFNDIIDIALGNPMRERDLHIRPNALITIGAKADGFITHVTYPDVTGMVTRYWRWEGDGDYVHKLKIVKDSIEHIFIMGDDILTTMDRAYTILEETQVHLEEAL